MFQFILQSGDMSDLPAVDFTKPYVGPTGKPKRNKKLCKIKKQSKKCNRSG